MFIDVQGEDHSVLSLKLGHVFHLKIHAAVRFSLFLFELFFSLTKRVEAVRELTI